MTVLLKVVQTPIVALYTGLSAVGSSMTITPVPADLDGVALTMSDFGNTGYCTIDPKISGYEEIVSFTGLTANGDKTVTLTGLTRDLQSKYPYTGSGTGKLHGASAVVVFSNNPQIYGRFAGKDNDETITGQWTFSVFPITPVTQLATSTVAGFTKLSINAANPASPIAVGDNDTRVPSADPTTLFAGIATKVPTGMVSPYAGRTAPTGFLLCDGSAVSRTTYAALLAAIAPSGTFTVTIASPGVFTKATHGFILGDKVHLTTSAAGLPSGLAVNTDYWVGVKDANSFWLFDTKAHAFADNNVGSGTGVIVTTGSQSGVHTIYASSWGKGDGSTTFNVPDLRGLTFYGQKTSDANFDTLNTPNTYVGEKTHTLLAAELPNINLSIPLWPPAATFDTTHVAYGENGGAGTGATIPLGGSGTAMNNMPPYGIGLYIIKT